MPDLYPMQPHGELPESREALLVAEREVIGLEDPAAALTDFKDWNEARDWTRRLTAHLLEHSGWGLHLTLRVPQAFVNYGFDLAVGHKYHRSCYVQDDVGQNVLRGAAAVSAVRLAAGRTEFTFPFNLLAPSASKVAITEFENNAHEHEANFGAGYRRCRLELESVTLPNKIVVRRYQFGAPVAGVDEDGFYCFGVHCAP